MTLRIHRLLPTRRQRILAASILTFWLFVGFVATWAVLIEPARLVVRESTLELPGLPAALRGLRIAVVSDLHAGAPHMDEARLEDIVRRVNAARPELVVLLGDFVATRVVGGHPIDAEAAAAPFRGLEAPAGVFAVLGNHDWWYDGPRMRKALEGAGITVLENEVAAVSRGGGTMRLAGLADRMTRSPDILGTLEKVPAGAPVIVLSHNPDVFPAIPPEVLLTLAGHTHGGQVDLPFFGALVVPSSYGTRFLAGHVVEGGRHLFVTTGVGTSLLPVRFGVPPEVVLLTLETGTAR